MHCYVLGPNGSISMLPVTATVRRQFAPELWLHERAATVERMMTELLGEIHGLRRFIRRQVMHRLGGNIEHHSIRYHRSRLKQLRQRLREFYQEYLAIARRVLLRLRLN